MNMPYETFGVWGIEQYIILAVIVLCLAGIVYILVKNWGEMNMTEEGKTDWLILWLGILFGMIPGLIIGYLAAGVWIH